MKQLVELNRNGAAQFKELGVEVVAVFREEKEGLAGLKKIKQRVDVDFSLALDTPATVTKAYSNGRKEFDSYVVDNHGIVKAVIDGSLKTRAQTEQLLAIVTALRAESNAAPAVDEKAAVERAVLDYIEGVYEVRTDLIQRGVHPDLKMFGYKGATKESAATMTFSQLIDFASKYNADGKIPKDGSKEVKVFEVEANLASARLTSSWGTDMIHLVKEDGQWKIMQVIWQAKPK